MTPVVLALDLGACTGWATNAFRQLSGGTVHFGGDLTERLVAFRHWLEAKNRTCGPFTVVVYELPIVRGRAATKSLFGMQGVVRAVAGEYAGILDVNTQTLKKWAGRGDGEKAGTIARCEALGIVPWDDNHADAVCLLHYTLEKMEVRRD